MSTFQLAELNASMEENGLFSSKLKSNAAFESDENE